MYSYTITQDCCFGKFCLGARVNRGQRPIVFNNRALSPIYPIYPIYRTPPAPSNAIANQIACMPQRAAGLFIKKRGDIIFYFLLTYLSLS